MPDNVRVPPRFVPTLTSVIEEPPPLPMPLPMPLPLPVQAANAALTPPDFSVLLAPSEPAADSAAPARPEAPDDRMALAEAALFRIEEDLMHRVLQRVDLSLEERLTDAVSAAVQEQLDVMLPRLRGEIERVLRGLVVEALSRELSESTGSAPASGPESVG